MLSEISETRAAVRALGAVAAPEGFWNRVLAHVDAREPTAPIVDLTTQRMRRAARPSGRRVATLAAAAAAAAFVVGVVAVPSAQVERVRPAVATFSQDHATRSSVGDDAISSLASVAVSKFGR